MWMPGSRSAWGLTASAAGRVRNVTLHDYKPPLQAILAIAISRSLAMTLSEPCIGFSKVL